MLSTPSFTPKAVQLDGNTSLSIPSLTCADSTDYSFFCWFQEIDDNFDRYMWVSSPNDFVNYFQLRNNGVNVQTFVSLADAIGSKILDADNFPRVPINAAWHWTLISADTNHGAGAKKIKIFNDGVDRTDNIDDFDSAFTIEMNGRDFYVGEDGFGDFIKGKFSTFWLAPGVSLLDGSGTIPLATRNIFVNAGVPQDPAGFPSAAILFDGDASSWGTNQGTGGAFTLNGGPLTTVPGP